jgi:hypothetical protein
MAKLHSLILMGSVLILIIIGGMVADQYQYPLPSNGSRGSPGAISENFKVNSVLDIRQHSSLDSNSKDFTDTDQSSKLDKIKDKINKNQKDLLKLQDHKKEMNSSLNELNKGISDLQKQRDDFIKAQMEIKKMLFT